MLVFWWLYIDLAICLHRILILCNIFNVLLSFKCKGLFHTSSRSKRIHMQMTICCCHMAGSSLSVLLITRSLLILLSLILLALYDQSCQIINTLDGEENIINLSSAVSNLLGICSQNFFFQTFSLLICGGNVTRIFFVSSIVLLEWLFYEKFYLYIQYSCWQLSYFSQFTLKK